MAGPLSPDRSESPAPETGKWWPRKPLRPARSLVEVIKEDVHHQINPAVWERRDMREAIASRDIGTVYRLLQRYGVQQRWIAVLTDQSQSEVSGIIAGRRVYSYDVLVRIAHGLGIPRGWMGLAHVDGPGEVP